MCTLTFMPQETGGFLLGINRDENVTRQLSKDLRAGITTHGISYVFPVDPERGGTWIGMNSSGIVCALLNQHPPEYKLEAKTYRSRGELIPTLLNFETAEQGINHLLEFEPNDFPPFLLLVFDAQKTEARSLYSNGSTFTKSDLPWAPHLKSSSSFNEKLAWEVRSKAFTDFFLSKNTAKCGLETLIEFHSLTSTTTPEIAVCMQRKEARTVSLTLVEVTTTEMTLKYCPKSPIDLHSKDEFLIKTLEISNSQKTRDEDKT